MQADAINPERSAQELVKIYASKAAYGAECMAEKLLGRGDKIGFKTWREIASVVRRIQEDESRNR